MARNHERRRLSCEQSKGEIRTSVATVSILGTYRDPRPITAHRIALLRAITTALVRRRAWTELDVVLLPAGYFRFARSIGHLRSPDRIASLQDLAFAKASAEASLVLDQRWPGVSLVIGADSNALDSDHAGDQLALAWQRGAITGIARKAFPVWNETCDWEANVWINPEDAEDERRILTLRNGARAILCVCYDAFALRAIRGEHYADLAAIRFALHGSGTIGPFEFGDRWLHLSRWTNLIRYSAADLALVPIHYFWQPGRDGYWQRHGIAGASAALDGAPVLGAAHFQNLLPRIDVSPLAAAGVEPEHLTKGGKRLAQRLLPDDGFYLHGPDGDAIALIRLFHLDRTTRLSP